MKNLEEHIIIFSPALQYPWLLWEGAGGIDLYVRTSIMIVGLGSMYNPPLP